MGLKVGGVPTVVGAHRLTVLFADGEVPDAAQVCHKCGHSLCVRRSHLYLGNASSNAEDKATHGHFQWAIGANHPLSKLTEDQVREIMERLAAGESKAALAREFDITATLIYNIATGRTWRHVTLLPGPRD
jgi:hypothetical protein